MTIPELFESSVTKYGQNPVLWEKLGEAYTSISYAEAYQRVLNFANGLLWLGVHKNDKIILLAEGRSEWVIAELGVLYTGAVSVPVSVKIDEIGELQFRMEHSEARFIIVSGRQLPKILQFKNKLPRVEKVILLDDMEVNDENIISHSELLKQGIQYRQENPDKLLNITKQIQPDDYANICYTSGTTADPKGILLTHRNYTANVWQASLLFDVPQWYVSLMILPWDHSFAHTVGIYTLLKNGASLASVQLGKSYIETVKNIPVNIRETRPVFLLSVPALAKNFKASIEKGIRDKGSFTNKLFHAALKTAYYYNSFGYDKGKGLRILVKPLYKLFDLILFKKIRAVFGGRLKFFVGGGALLDIDFQRFFYAIGIPIFQGYGLTEASPIISSNTPEFHKLGSSGKPVSNMELKICDEQGNSLKQGQQGEIVIKGENVMAGYWRNDKATAQTVRDGWLFTGDLGYLDPDGYLYVLGRFKSLLIGSDGEKYSPEAIEEAMVNNSQFIDQVMLYNNQKPYTVALIVPNFERLKSYIKEKNNVSTESDAQKQAVKLIHDEISQYLEGGKFHGLFPKRWIPSSFAIITEPFSEQNRMINSTMKMVRGRITEEYLPRITYMYTAEGKDIFNRLNLDALGKNAFEE
ncbi:MAG TPA: AMP-binding protein [Bacteroidales bacterium]|nr:AMP-binding protein [Bacteroidales bacterium]